MRAVVISPPERWLEERRRTGADRWDEVWEGVLHMVPAPGAHHQGMGSELVVALWAVARPKGLRVYYETGLFRPGSGGEDYRVPDLMVTRPEVMTERGVEGPPELVIEILSEGDESREKLPFFAAVGAREVWLLEPETRVLEVFVLEEGRLRPQAPDDSGTHRCSVLPLTLATEEGPLLAIRWADGQTRI